eukprot:6183669-Pleurochrysis_carterae.AAC.2
MRTPGSTGDQTTSSTEPSCPTYGSGSTVHDAPSPRHTCTLPAQSPLASVPCCTCGGHIEHVFARTPLDHECVNQPAFGSSAKPSRSSAPPSRSSPMQSEDCSDGKRLGFKFMDPTSDTA